MIPKEELAAVHELYRNANNGIKKRVEKDYAGKYQGETDVQKELYLAEEWFAESLASFMGEKTMRGDISKALGGDLSNVRLKNSFERAIDRVIDYISYVVNGLIGRKDIRQQFRRLMIHGDMLESTRKSAFSSKADAVSPEYAAYLGHDALRYSKPTKKAAIAKFNGGGKFSVNEDGSPVLYFHGTPNGRAFEDSQVVMQPSGEGFYGSGIYVTPNSKIANRVYAQNSTPTSQQNILDSMDLNEDEYFDAEFDINNLYSIRRELSQARRDLANAEEAVQSHNNEVARIKGVDALDDESVAFFNVELKSLEKEEADLRQVIERGLSIESKLVTQLSEVGIGDTPTVLPLVTRMLNTFDFGKGVSHRPFSPESQAIMEAVSNLGVSRQAFEKAIADNKFPEAGLKGTDVYYFYVRTIAKDLDISTTDGQEYFREALESLGYDSMRAPHSNTVSGNFAKGEDPASAELVEYDAFVMFNPESVKHVNAEFFDELDPRMYYRDFSDAPRGYTGAAATAMIEGTVDKLDATNTLKYFEALEDDGAPPAFVDAMGAILRERSFSPVEEQAVRKAGPLGFLSAQSERFHKMGMDFMGNWYKDHFPNQHQSFASKYMPIHNMLRQLPGADGKVRAWARRSTGSLGQKHPEPYKKILSALRRGDQSRIAKTLSARERSVYNAIRGKFAEEHTKMTEAGMNVGYRRDYVPQVWNREKIQKYGWIS